MVPTAADEENSSPSIPPANPANPAVEDPAVKSVLRRWKIEESLGNSALILRALAWIFSALGFVIMASNRHGDWRNFWLSPSSPSSTRRRNSSEKFLDRAAGATCCRRARQLPRISPAIRFPQKNYFSTWMNKQSNAITLTNSLLNLDDHQPANVGGFDNDRLIYSQIAAYLLMSGVSAAAPITNRMREGVTNSFTDASAASIAMTFFAFATLALSALLSGFKLARHNYA